MEKDWRVMVTVLVVSLFLNVALFSSVAFTSLFDPSITSATIVDQAELEVFTKAVCQQTSQGTECYDEIYVTCDGVQTKVGTVQGEQGSLQLI